MKMKMKMRKKEEKEERGRNLWHCRRRPGEVPCCLVRSSCSGPHHAQSAPAPPGHSSSCRPGEVQSSPCRQEYQISIQP